MATYKILSASVSGASGADFKEGQIVDGGRLANIKEHLLSGDIVEYAEPTTEPEPKKSGSKSNV